MNPEDAIERVGKLAESAAVAAAEPGTSLVPTGADEAQAVKADMVGRRAELLRQKQAVEAAAADAKAAVEAQVAALNAQLQEQLALLDPLKKTLARLSDGVDALNIYLGRDEELICIREGERAPADTVITVRQQVLAMDEESLIAVDKSGMDFQDIDKFADWLTRDPAHLEQLLPEVKGVVALIPRRAQKRYSDPWMQQSADDLNAQTWWLARNGEAVFLTSTAFSVGDNTVPSPKEFTDMFVVRGSFGRPDRPMAPGSQEWAQAEERADARTRHYMKVALLLQGLLDRTAVFHPHNGVSFLNQSHYDAGLVRVILDGEGQLTDGRPSFVDWRRERVSKLHTGMRVIGAFGARMLTYDARDRDAEVRPKGCRPESYVPYTIRPSKRSYFEWEFLFERTEKIFDEETWSYRKPKTKATGYLSESDTWWLPLDTITEEEIHYYLNARSQRTDYLNMIPALRAALEVKVAERLTEAPFRSALIDALAREAGLDGGEALADDLIAWYKTGNQYHRALDPFDEKAAKLILTEARRRAKGGQKDAERTSELLALHPGAMVVARRSADFVVAVPQRRVHASADQQTFATLHVYTPAGTLKETREWVTLTRAQVARWTVLHHSDTWSEWNFNPNMDTSFTDDELDALAQWVRAKYPNTFRVTIDTSHKKDHALGKAWTLEKNGVHSSSLRADRDKGVARVRSDYGLRPSTGSGEFPWLTRYYGEARPDRAVFVDDARQAEAETRWTADIAEAAAERAASDKVWQLRRQIAIAWEAEAEERVRLRFVEDFGDPGLWADHRKSVRLPQYPHELRRSTTLSAALRNAFREDPDADFAGLTVAQIAEQLGVGTDDLDEGTAHLIPVPQA